MANNSQLLSRERFGYRHSHRGPPEASTVARKCHPCPRTVSLPLSPDRTPPRSNIRMESTRGLQVGRARSLAGVRRTRPIVVLRMIRQTTTIISISAVFIVSLRAQHPLIQPSSYGTTFEGRALRFECVAILKSGGEQSLVDVFRTKSGRRGGSAWINCNSR